MRFSKEILMNIGRGRYIKKNEKILYISISLSIK
jgi:hypothetical protein